MSYIRSDAWREDSQIKEDLQKYTGQLFKREINIQLDGHPICRVEHAKSLGFIIDDRLSRSNHIKELCRKISSAIGALRFPCIK